MSALPSVATRPHQASRSARVGEIVASARAIVDTEGAEALTMRRIAADLGIKAPSLYKHLSNRDELLAMLADDVLFHAGDACHAALDRPGRRSPVAALLATYRRVGLDHPNLYRVATGAGLPRASLTPGLETWSGESFYRATGDPHVAQALWAFAHGMVVLEIDGRFLPGSDLERTWREGASVFGERSPRRTPTTTRPVRPCG